MPTIFEHWGLKYKINANDHNPPHVHIEGRGCEARIDLMDFSIMSSSGFSGKDLKKILQIVKFYQEELLEAWNEFHE